MLKTLEEPGHGLLVLITAAPERLLATILSRCQRIPFKPLPAQIEIGMGAPSAKARKKTPGRQGPPHAIRAGKQISRSQALLLQRSGEQLKGLLLPFDSGK